MGESSGGDGRSSGEAKICQFQLSFAVDEEILRFEIAMEDFSSVDERQAPQELEEENLGVAGEETVRIVLQILGEIHLQILKDKGERRLLVNDLVEGDDVGVSEAFEEGGLADGREWDALLGLKLYLLQGNDCPGHHIAAAMNGGVGAFAQLLHTEEFGPPMARGERDEGRSGGRRGWTMAPCRSQGV